MVISRVRAPLRHRVVLSVLTLSLLLCVAALVSPGVQAAGSSEGALNERPVTDRAGGEESDDPFHVSDESLAVAIFIPAIFLLATGATVAWALRARNRDGEDADEE